MSSAVKPCSAALAFSRSFFPAVPPIFTAPVSPPDLPVLNTQFPFLSCTKEPLFLLSVNVQSFGFLDFFFPLTSGLSYATTLSPSRLTSSIIPGAFLARSSIAETTDGLVFGA